MKVALEVSCDPQAEDIAIAVADDLALAALLLVTSDPQQALASKLGLESQGYYVVCARLAGEALQLLQRIPFDLVIVDAILPDMHGLDLIGKIAEWDAHLPIILNSDKHDVTSNFRYWAADAVVDQSGDRRPLLHDVKSLLQNRGPAC